MIAQNEDDLGKPGTCSCRHDFAASLHNPADGDVIGQDVRHEPAKAPILGGLHHPPGKLGPDAQPLPVVADDEPKFGAVVIK